MKGILNQQRKFIKVTYLLIEPSNSHFIEKKHYNLDIIFIMEIHLSSLTLILLFFLAKPFKHRLDSSVLLGDNKIIKILFQNSNLITFIHDICLFGPFLNPTSLTLQTDH